jgi:imidazolonepropionase
MVFLAWALDKLSAGEICIDILADSPAPSESGMTCDRLWTNARLATMRDGLGVVEQGAVAAKDGRIVFAGLASDPPQASEIIDCEGRWITPGLIDCHTHLVHGGDRAHEFELRLQGASYEEIARAGGGIVSTMAATRAASEDELVAPACPGSTR